MTLIPVFFFWYIGAVMHHTEGHYDITAGKFTGFFFLTVFVMMWKPVGSTFALKHREKLWNLALSLAAALGCYTLAHKPLMIYAQEQSPFMGLFHALMWAAVGITAVLPVLVLAGVEKARLKIAFCAAAVAAIVVLFVAQCFVPILSPKPWIDVWVNNTAAVDHFLSGQNPYSQIYPDIYNGAYDYKPGFLYFPGLLFWLAPFRMIFGDIRYGFVFANFLIAGGAVLLSRKLRVSWPTSFVLAVLWLSFPVTFFVLEQSWIDTVLGALAMLAFVAIAYKRWVLCGVFLGAAFAVKQYGCVIGFIALILIWKEVHWRPALRAAVAAAGTFLVFVAPFALADWGAFYGSTVGDHTSSGARLDAYNATIYFAREFGWLMPASGRLAISLLGILGAGYFVFRKHAPSLADGATAIFVAFGLPFLFGKWAFCNYYYLLASILLIYLVARSRDQVESQL